MRSRYCCVPKCYSNNEKNYNITCSKEIQNVWIERIGNPDLKNLRHISKAVICRNHFQAECIDTNGKLKKFALPTLHLPEYVSSPQNDDFFLYPPKVSNPSDSPRKMQDSREISLLDDVPELKVQIPRRVYTRQRSLNTRELNKDNGVDGNENTFHTLKQENFRNIEGTSDSRTLQDDIVNVKVEADENGDQSDNLHHGKPRYTALTAKKLVMPIKIEEEPQQDVNESFIGSSSPDVQNKKIKLEYDEIEEECEKNGVLDGNFVFVDANDATTIYSTLNPEEEIEEVIHVKSEDVKKEFNKEVIYIKPEGVKEEFNKEVDEPEFLDIEQIMVLTRLKKSLDTKK